MSIKLSVKVHGIDANNKIVNSISDLRDTLTDEIIIRDYVGRELDTIKATLVANNLKTQADRIVRAVLTVTTTDETKHTYSYKTGRFGNRGPFDNP